MNSGTPAKTKEEARTFLGQVRHDLRTPINAILGYSEMLLEDAEAWPEFAAGLQEINTLGRKLHDTINHILHNDALDKRSLEELTDQARHNLGPPCQLILDRCVHLQEQTKVPALHSFAPDLANIFQASQRFRAMLTRDLGLDKAHSKEPTSAPQEPQEEIQAPPNQEIDQAQVGTILVVDDNEFNRDLLARGLVRQGHRYGLATHGKEALEMLARKNYDLVLLDIMMPEMDGFEVLARIKADPVRKHIPVIMISALDQIDSVVRCIEMGAEDYLPKPFDPVLLRARVGACLEKKRLRDHELEYLRNVAAVTDAAAAVESSSFDPATLEEVAQRTDQLGQLARVFQSMAREVAARVERLQMQVQQLKVEIDETRKAKQVAEIIETDYFQELQKKAQNLRRRKP
jgi:two-component system cell cycle response regulator